MKLILDGCSDEAEFTKEKQAGRSSSHPPPQACPVKGQSGLPARARPRGSAQAALRGQGTRAALLSAEPKRQHQDPRTPACLGHGLGRGHSGELTLPAPYSASALTWTPWTGLFAREPWKPETAQGLGADLGGSSSHGQWDRPKGPGC